MHFHILLLEHRLKKYYYLLKLIIQNKSVNRYLCRIIFKCDLELSGIFSQFHYHFEKYV